jgi:ABC-2 type transport system ATP-binding protein
MTDDAAIQASGLEKSYGAIRVLSGIDLRIDAGSVFALLGPNGAGKTTAVRILATLTKPDGGSALISGYDISSQRREVRARISLTGQYAALDELQTGSENLRMMGRLRHLSARAAHARAKELLTQFDLLDVASRRVGSYSGGMRRRLDLAAGLIGNPEVIFLDEPTTGLDPRGRGAMWRAISALAASGVTVFLTTQYLEEADRLADHIAVIDDGSIVAEGTAAELKRRVGGLRLDVSVIDALSFDALASDLGWRTVSCDRTRLTIGLAIKDGAAEARALLEEIDPERELITHFALHSASLDEVFMSLTGSRTTTPESEVTHV